MNYLAKSFPKKMSFKITLELHQIVTCEQICSGSAFQSLA